MRRGRLPARGYLHATVPWTAARLTDNWADRDGDILVVLSGATVRTSIYPQSVVIGGGSYRRVVHAVWAWQQGHFRHIVMAGTGSEEVHSAHLWRATRRGVGRDSIHEHARECPFREAASRSVPSRADRAAYQRLSHVSCCPLLPSCWHRSDYAPVPRLAEELQ